MVAFIIPILIVTCLTTSEAVCDKSDNATCCDVQCIRNENSCAQPCSSGMHWLSNHNLTNSCSLSTKYFNETEICVLSCPVNFTAIFDDNVSVCVHCSDVCNDQDTFSDECSCIHSMDSTKSLPSSKSVLTSESPTTTGSPITDIKTTEKVDNEFKISNEIVFTLMGACALFLALTIVGFVCSCKWRAKYRIESQKLKKLETPPTNVRHGENEYVGYERQHSNETEHQSPSNPVNVNSSNIIKPSGEQTPERVSYAVIGDDTMAADHIYDRMSSVLEKQSPQLQKEQNIKGKFRKKQSTKKKKKKNNHDKVRMDKNKNRNITKSNVYDELPFEQHSTNEIQKDLTKTSENQKNKLKKDMKLTENEKSSKKEKAKTSTETKKYNDPPSNLGTKAGEKDINSYWEMGDSRQPKPLELANIYESMTEKSPVAKDYLSPKPEVLMDTYESMEGVLETKKNLLPKLPPPSRDIYESMTEITPGSKRDVSTEKKTNHITETKLKVKDEKSTNKISEHLKEATPQFNAYGELPFRGTTKTTETEQNQYLDMRDTYKPKDTEPTGTGKMSSDSFLDQSQPGVLLRDHQNDFDGREIEKHNKGHINDADLGNRSEQVPILPPRLETKVVAPSKQNVDENEYGNIPKRNNSEDNASTIVHPDVNSKEHSSKNGTEANDSSSDTRFEGHPWEPPSQIRSETAHWIDPEEVHQRISASSERFSFQPFRRFSGSYESSCNEDRCISDDTLADKVEAAKWVSDKLSKIG